MTKRSKNKKNAFKNNLKFEVYGILFIIFSIISLAGKEEIPGIGSVGRSLSYIFFFVTGAHFYVIPLLAIGVGLYLVMKRKWPAKWSYRKSGLLLIILAVLIFYHISLFQQLDPDGEYYSTGEIMLQPYHNMQDYLSQQKEPEAFKNELGGGMVGAFFYGILFLLFDRLGAKLVVFALLLIGFICLTGWSFSDLAKKVKSVSRPIFRGIKKSFAEFKMLRVARIKKNKSKSISSLDPPGDGLKNGHNGPRSEDEKVRQGAAPEVHFQDKELDDHMADPVRPISEPSPVIRDFYEQVEAESKKHQGQKHPPIRELSKFVHESETESPVTQKSEQQDEEENGQLAITDIEFSAEKEQMKPYQLPSYHLLSKPEQNQQHTSGNQYRENAKKLEDTLQSFGVRAKVLEVVKGPTVTRYEIQPDIGVKVSRIVSLTDDIALALAAKDIRMEAPIPGKAAIGIEVPNTSVSMVTLREVMESSAFHESKSKISVALGRDISGQPMIADLAKMPHLLVAGATGSGKSVCINGLIISVLFKAKPNEVKFLMIDPKKVELNGYNGIPHLLAPVVTDPRRASMALKKVVVEMEHRYELFSNSGTRNIEGYNEHLMKTESGEPLPYIVVIVDELADLMMVAANDVEDSITRLAQMARAAGIHLIIATQRPSVNVITGVIKANIPSRIAFGVSSQVDSRTILDSVGAEKLLGRGDMLFLPVGAAKPTRIQGAFLTDEEVESVINYAKEQEKAEYNEELVPELNEQAFDAPDELEDELYDQAVQIILEAKQASVSLLQRRMRIGYTRAARLIDSMEAKGVVGPYEGSKPREVLVTPEDLEAKKASSE